MSTVSRGKGANSWGGNNTTSAYFRVLKWCMVLDLGNMRHCEAEYVFVESEVTDWWSCDAFLQLSILSLLLMNSGTTSHRKHAFLLVCTTQSCFLSPTYLLIVGVEDIVSPQWHTHTHTHTHTHLVRLLWTRDRPSQRPLPNNTQQSQDADVHSPHGIRTPNSSNPP